MDKSSFYRIVKAPTQTGSPVARKLLAYWTEHPGAQGTVEEIVSWWVLEQRLRETIQDVQRALDDLVKAGVIDQGQHLDGRACYRLRRSTLERN